MAFVATGIVAQAELERHIAKAVKKLGKDAVHVNYSLGMDWTDEPALFFRVVLTDAASREDGLVDVTERIRAAIDQEVRPYERWGLASHFNFRSASEQKALQDPAWA
jgi:hypothetical protein